MILFFSELKILKIAYIMSTFDHSDIKYKYSVGWFLVDSFKETWY